MGTETGTCGSHRTTSVYRIERTREAAAAGEEPQWEAVIATSFREIAIRDFQALRHTLKPGEAVRAVAPDGVVLEAMEAKMAPG